MIKRIFCVVMCLVMFMSIGTIAFAAEPESEEVTGVQPYYNYTDKLFTSLIYAGEGEVNCFAYAFGKEGVATQTGIDMYLQKRTLFWWSNTDYEWHTLAPGDYAELKAYHYALPSKGTYRLKSIVTVYSGNQKEEIEIISNQYTYGG